MIRNELNAQLRQYAKAQLTPTQVEQDLVSRLYGAFGRILGGQCFMVGSFPRYTAVRPIHDLDILYVLGQVSRLERNPAQVLSDLKNRIDTQFQNPTQFNIRVELQTHSVTVIFLRRDAEKFSVDIVPAYASGIQNEFGEDVYDVPEVVRVKHRRRKSYYEALAQQRKEMQWIRSDPRGYIRVASQVNGRNGDFRKAVKIVKKWKHACSDLDENFKLKSFHVELVVTRLFQNNAQIDVYGAIFKFFCEIGDILTAHIPDRADQSCNIDEYVDELTFSERQLIFAARDDVMIKLENFKAGQSLETVFGGGFYSRRCSDEQYLFDSSIHVLTDPSLSFRIDGELVRKAGFRNYWLSEQGGMVGGDREINFQICQDTTCADLFKWKVKNEDSCEQPRGEITDSHTRRTPEATKYLGHHYVECYAIKGNICIARAKQNVIIE